MPFQLESKADQYVSSRYGTKFHYGGPELHNASQDIAGLADLSETSVKLLDPGNISGHCEYQEHLSLPEKKFLHTHPSSIPCH